MSDSVVLRFAPSPTGPLHIGGVRTALYNYLLYRKLGGRFILRLEDTDQTRFVAGAETHIIESLHWLGIEFSEGAHLGGAVGPYRQSERKAQGIYQPYVDQLVEEGKAYLAFDTPEELNEMREKLKASGSKTQHYNFVTRNNMKNSLTLSKSEVKARIDAGEPYVVRMKIPRKEEIRFQDTIRGWVMFHSSQLDDKILLKSDGMPTYHMANIVDDHLMGITHVIRGEEWLSSTPLHVLLYRALGWGDQIPQFVHLPLILNPNGVGKMSKRQADKQGFSVFPISWQVAGSEEVYTGYREDGYLPDAMRNFLSLLGWNPGNDEEVMDLDRLSELFSLERLGNSATNFDLDKLKWFNQVYIRKMSTDELLPLVKEEAIKQGISAPSEELLRQLIPLLQERVTILPDFISQATYLFTAPKEYDAKTVKKRWKTDSPTLLQELSEKFQNLGSWESAHLEQAFEELIEEKNVGKGKVLAPLRLALTGVSFGPGAFDIAAILGKEETLHRIDQAVRQLVPIN